MCYSHWIDYFSPRPDAALRLFCIPFAGADASIFRTWAERLPAAVEVLPIQLPGRGKRFRDAPITRMEPLRERMLDALLPLCRRPFAFFGHSMGGLIAFELTRFMERTHIARPAFVMISGCAPPRARIRRSRPRLLSSMPDRQLIAELSMMNGTPREILENPEYFRLFAPTIRADFELAESATFESGETLKCPILGFSGTNDVQAPPDVMLHWRAFTSGYFDLILIPGDHFFLVRRRQYFLEVLSSRLPSVLDMIARQMPSDAQP